MNSHSISRDVATSMTEYAIERIIGLAFPFILLAIALALMRWPAPIPLLVIMMTAGLNTRLI
jgi:hypothetical protein